MPTPEPPKKGLGVLVVMRAELAVFAGVLGHSNERITDKLHRFLEIRRSLKANGHDTDELPAIFTEIFEGFLHVHVGREFDDFVLVVSKD